DPAHLARRDRQGRHGVRRRRHRGRHERLDSIHAHRHADADPQGLAERLRGRPDGVRFEPHRRRLARRLLRRGRPRRLLLSRVPAKRDRAGSHLLRQNAATLEYRRRVRLGPIAVAIAVTCGAARASASPEDLFGYGAESPAMAGTGTATSSDFEAAYTNPALLSRIRRPKLALGFLGANFDEVASSARAVPPSAGPATGDGLPGRIEDRSARGLDIGADLPIPLGGVLKDRVSGALAFYTPSEVVVRGRI